MGPSISLTKDTLETLEASFLNVTGMVPLHDRFRALFTLKAAQEQEKVIEIIGKGVFVHFPFAIHFILVHRHSVSCRSYCTALGFTDQSALLKHELAYVLGQMKNPSALPTLERVLRDLKEDPMVRHEAAEAMGAISSVQSIPKLKEFLIDQRQEVRETCEIALAKVEWDNSEEGKAETTKSQGDTPLVYQYTVTCGFSFIYLFFRQFTSEDPAPPVPRRSFGRHPPRAHLTQTPTF